MKKAQRILNQLIKDLKNKDFKYEAKEEKEINWSQYNLAKINEIKFVLMFIRAAVDGVEARFLERGGPGRPLSSAFDLAKIILVKEYFETGERQAEGLSDLFSEKLALKHPYSASTIGRAYSRTDVQQILMRIFDLTSEPIKDKETSFSGDGTGLPLSIKQNYANDRDDEAKHAGYDKAMLVVSNNFHIITGFVYAEGTANDCPLFAPAFEQTKRKFARINDVELDAGFVSRDNCQLIADAGATPYIYPKVGITLNQDGAPAWKDMYLSLTEDAQAWLRGYHPRSQSESVNSTHKRRFTRPLLRKLRPRREVESLCRFIITNAIMLITAYCELRVEVPQLEKGYF
jgi:transposase